MRPSLPCLLLLAILSPASALAESPGRPEVWACKGVRQTAPGGPLEPQERTLTLYPEKGRAVMKVGEAEYQGRFEASGPHVAAWFEWTGAGGEVLSEDANLGLLTGKLAASVKRKDGTQVGLYRGGCQTGGGGRPEGAGGGPK